MYFLWRNTKYGLIRVSRDGLYDFADEVLRSKLKLYSVTLTPSGKKEHSEIIIVLSEEDLRPETKSEIEQHFTEILKPMGMNASIVWADPERGIWEFIRNPYTWALVASCSAVIITAGFEGFFWTSFWGAAAWFGVRGLSLIVRKFRRT